ncbi:ZNF85 protein, partial [Himantopus himantopus]|nr:ZNF85 protein [Himantopus himantopus]
RVNHRSSLITHRRIHTSDMPYKCPDCGKSYRISNNLRRHRKTHTDERPYRCEECGKSFRHKSTLTIH